MNKFISYFKKFSEILTTISGVIILILSLLVCAHVILRGVFNSGINGIYEIVQYSMLTVVSLSLAENELTGGSIIVNYILDKMKPRTANIFSIVTYIASMAFMIYVLSNQLSNTAGKYSSGATTGVLHIPHWAIGGMICVGLFFFILAFFIKIYTMITEHKNISNEKLSADELAIQAASNVENDF